MTQKNKRRLFYLLAVLCVVAGVPVFLYDYSPSLRFKVNTFVIGVVHSISDSGWVARETLGSNGSTLFSAYDPDTPRDDPEERRLRERLIKFVESTEKNPPNLILTKRQKRYQLFVPIKQGDKPNPETIEAVKAYGRTLSLNVFWNVELDIHLTDDFQRTLRVFPIPMQKP